MLDDIKNYKGIINIHCSKKMASVNNKTISINSTILQTEQQLHPSRSKSIICLGPIWDNEWQISNLTGFQHERQD